MISGPVFLFILIFYKFFCFNCAPFELKIGKSMGENSFIFGTLFYCVMVLRFIIANNNYKEKFNKSNLGIKLIQSFKFKKYVYKYVLCSLVILHQIVFIFYPVFVYYFI